MSWSIPAKTFLLGEYAAVAGAGAIILTTFPCFELKLAEDPSSSDIHPDSPAGRWWSACGAQSKMTWHDPWSGLGGLGASSAQFLGAWLASCQTRNLQPEMSEMLEAYYQSAWTGQGLRPSGYDVIAQSQQQCVYINQKKDMIETCSWLFDELSFLLVHSGHKLATHHHLQTATLPDTTTLSSIVEQARQAFQNKDAQQLVSAINEYQQELSALGLTASHTLEQIKSLSADIPIMAAKGCGALGADVLLLLIHSKDKAELSDYLAKKGCRILANEENLYKGPALI